MTKKDMEIMNAVYREIGEQCGVETALKIHHMFRGQQITFPVRLFDKDAVHARIAEEYDGTNIRKLAEEYKYSEKTIRRIIKEAGKGKPHIDTDNDHNKEE